MINTIVTVRIVKIHPTNPRCYARLWLKSAYRFILETNIASSRASGTTTEGSGGISAPPRGRRRSRRHQRDRGELRARLRVFSEEEGSVQSDCLVSKVFILFNPTFRKYLRNPKSMHSNWSFAKFLPLRSTLIVA